MTVTDITAMREQAESALRDLAQQIDQVIGTSYAMVTLEAARAATKECGLRRFQEMLLDALDQLDVARKAKRSATVDLDTAKSDYQTALAEAQWVLGDSFEARSNKTWLARNPDGTAIVEDEQRSMTADEKKDWIGRNAERVPAVAAAKRRLDQVTELVAQANDDIAQCERTAKSTEHLLDSAVAELDVLRLALLHPAAHTTGARS